MVLQQSDIVRRFCWDHFKWLAEPPNRFCEQDFLQNKAFPRLYRPFTGWFAGSALTKDGILLRGSEVGWPTCLSFWFPATKRTDPCRDCRALVFFFMLTLYTDLQGGSGYCKIYKTWFACWRLNEVTWTSCQLCSSASSLVRNCGSHQIISPFPTPGLVYKIHWDLIMLNLPNDYD